MLTLNDALEHLGYDPYDPEEIDETVKRNVQRALNAADATLRGAVGEDIHTYLPDDPRVDTLTLAYLDDLYDTRGAYAKAENALRGLIHTQELQLKLELRRAREAGDGV